MSRGYRTGTLKSSREGAGLKGLFNEIFHPEKAGDLAEVMLSHLPRTKPEYWFTAEHISSGRLCAGLTLIPWTLNFEGISLKAAEMGIVGTLGKHRGRGLIKKLSSMFDETCLNDKYDLQIVQGVPGFYHKLGYHYALPLDNHINLPLHAVEKDDNKEYSIKQCGPEDIPFLEIRDQTDSGRYMISTVRDRKNWRYIFTHGLKTEYMSEFYIIEKTGRTGTAEKYYLRINMAGFGNGLIVSEISEDISAEALSRAFSFLKDLSEKRDKPYIRLNIPESSVAAQRAFSLGAVQMQMYGWQIKITDKKKFLAKIRPVLEKRVAESGFRNFTGTVCLDFYIRQIYLSWKNGKLKKISENGMEPSMTLSLTEDLFIPLCLGYRSLKELRYIRHDLYCENPLTGEFIDTIFPKKNSWINYQY